MDLILNVVVWIMGVLSGCLLDKSSELVEGFCLSQWLGNGYDKLFNVHRNHLDSGG